MKQSTINPSEEYQINLILNADSLEIGEYIANLKLNTNDPDESIINVPILLNVEENDLSLLIDYKPNEYRLKSIYPNPFNPVTKIKYSVPENNQVSISIYDIKGNMISELINKNHYIGIYNITWNAEGYPSGVYFVKLNAGDFTQTQKLMLIK